MAEDAVVINWTLILTVLALTSPPSVAYVVSLLVQWRIERAKDLNAQHAQVLIAHEQSIDEHADKLAGLEALVQQQQTTINKLAEREF